MKGFKEKRESLELFVKEQIEGPGAYNKRYFFLKDLEDLNFEYYRKNLKGESAFKNVSEVLPEVPAYQYSSGILFPETHLNVDSNGKQKNLEQVDILEKEDTIDENVGSRPAEDDDIDGDTSESLVSKQQNYPNQMGLSFVIAENANLDSDLHVTLNFRKYNRVSKKDCMKNKISIWIPEYEQEIKTAIQDFFPEIFAITEYNNNYFISFKQEVNSEIIYQIDYVYLNNYLKSNVLTRLENIFGIELRELNEKKGIKYFGVKIDSESQFFSIGTKKYRDNEFNHVITLFDDSIVAFIEKQLQKNVDYYLDYKELIRELEIFNQLKNIVTDLKSIFKERNPSPIWQSKASQLILKLPTHDRTKNIDRKEPMSVDSENNQFNELKYRVQYLTKNNLIYVKILLINYFKIILNPSDPPQLNKKDEANFKSFFGVQLIVSETTKGTLQQYNPPQLLAIDEEDNFNKLLYRNYLDYGEGYNTSVSWGKSNELTYISTDFLPEQETPKVDFQPSKIDGSKVTPRLSDERILSMRYLSSLSMIKDDQIIKGLKSFVKEYEIWIIEQSDILMLDTKLKDNEKALLTKQLLACKSDYKRLVRNIELLEQDRKAMSAFRIMNTAMFMQLHHSILKRNKETIGKKLDENYYNRLELKDDYRWRSFQLAFVLLNVDAFVRPKDEDKTVKDVFGNGWPERNEIADLVWFPTGGGKTEAYLGIIAFTIAYRRFTKGDRGFGTTVLMRYTLRLLTLQQFQRAALLVCALEVIRKDSFSIPDNYTLGDERITIGLFVGGGSLPNKWKSSGRQDDNTMFEELKKIIEAIQATRSGEKARIETNLPFTDCPWCGSNLFISETLDNVIPKPTVSGLEDNPKYGTAQADQLSICCNNTFCSFHNNRPTPKQSLPFRLFDDDIYKFPPTLLFGTVDKFAALANKVSTNSASKNEDSRRLLGKGYLANNQERNFLPPELIIQDELHLLLGPLGTAVGLFEKAIDKLCSYTENGQVIRPKIVTSTATTRNTDKQIFALFNRRSEIFPKQGIACDDSFFAYYQRDDDNNYISNRKYIGILPVGKTQVWMQLRMAAISLAHRLKYLKELFSLENLFESPNKLNEIIQVFNYYQTVLSYFNSLKDVGKTQSQLSHYLPGDLNYVIKNTIPWSFIDKITRRVGEIKYSELTGRLTGEEVKTNLSEIESDWNLTLKTTGITKLRSTNPPELVISTNMISVGIDVSRLNTMIISSMPRNVAEYIQASSRVARAIEGIVFTVHHPFRSRDISHYQKFKEFHEKFYSYVEPISVTPFANKALDRYLAMAVVVLIRHNDALNLRNNEDVVNYVDSKKILIRNMVMDEIKLVNKNGVNLDLYLRNRDVGVKSNVEGIIGLDEINDIKRKVDKLLEEWTIRLQEINSTNPPLDFRFRKESNLLESLFINGGDDNYPNHWKVSYSLREISPATVIKTVQQ